VPDGLSRFYAQRPEWSTCGDDWQCAKVEVPLDYAEPDGQAIRLAVNRRAADEPDRWRGALLVNPGGPGVAGTSYAKLVLPRLGDITDTYDLVGFDPRGVGDSAGLDCISDDTLDDYLGADGSPDTSAEVTGFVSRQKGLADSCRRRSGALLGHVSTVEAARDMDIVRHVVGDPDLHYFGASYGTLLGATYADLFPERVGRMVLDGAVDPTVGGAGLALAQAEGFETALQAYLADCVPGGDCPLGATVREANANLAELMDRIDREPLPGDGDRELTPGWAFYALALPLYAEDLWPLLDQALGAAVSGDGGPLLRLADLYVSRSSDGYVDDRMEAFVAISCLDNPRARTVAEVRADLPRFEAVSEVFGAAFAWSTMGCLGWPVRAADPIPRIDAAGAGPILVIGTTRDPATPYAWSQALADQLASGVLLTHDGDGHGAFGQGDGCVDGAVVGYLTRGTLPRAGTTC
jgi:pimeloyl-ACP methyl ester carboxylesterase